MYDKLVKELKANIARVAEIDAMAEITQELTAEQTALIEAQSVLQGKIERAKKQVEMGNFVNDAEANPPKEKRITSPVQVAASEILSFDAKKIPATAKRSIGTLRAFKGPDKELSAFRFGQFFMATAGLESARDYCRNTGMLMAVHNEGTNTAGGYLVPEEFGTDITRLVLEYGVFRANTNVVPMSSDTRTDPRRTSGMTAYWVGESTAGTESQIAWDQVRLTAKKLTALTRVTNELNADTAISIGDQVMNEIALAFAYAEDTAGFNGTGISTHGGITGVNTALKAIVGATTASAGGIIVSAENTYAEITLKELHSVVSICPTYARRNAKWYVSPVVHEVVMASLQTAAGGNAVVDIANGGMPRFLGYPVVLSEVEPSTAANSQVVCLFGDLSQASKLGDRMTRVISTSDQATIGGENLWELDQLAIKGTERIDINVHDVGTATVAGPIVGLQLYSS